MRVMAKTESTTDGVAGLISKKKGTREVHGNERTSKRLISQGNRARASFATARPMDPCALALDLSQDSALSNSLWKTIPSRLLAN